MSRKLGYTWYPKDFISDPDVMFMSAAERGVYRDLIDLAYMNDNLIKYSVEMLAKYTNSDVDTVQRVLDIKGNETGSGWSIPSCEKRIKITQKNRENGGKGGRPKTQTKPKQNPDVTQTERQRERERESKREIESECVKEITPTQTFSHFGKQPISDLKKNCATHSSWLEMIAMKNSISMEDVVLWFDAFCLHLGAIGKTEETEKEFKRYCASWIASELRQGRKPRNENKAVSQQKVSATEAMQQSLMKKYGKHV